VQLRQALNAAIEHLAAAHVGSPRMNAELLIMFTLDCDRAYLYAHPERKLTADEMQRYDEALARRGMGVPAQYITGHQEFWGLDLIVSPAVLVPRPETEHVVETVLELARDDERGRDAPATAGETPALQGSGVSTGRFGGRGLRIADVGTGSGAIAIALAKELPSAEIDATDISAEALEVARANAARHELTARIRFHQTDLLRGLHPSMPTAVVPGNPGLRRAVFDIVVSNPPYVGESEEDQVQLEVRKFEPRTAVFAGPTGLEVIERLIPQAHAALDPGGWLVFEISGTIADRVRSLLSGWSEVAITNDLQGIARVARARRSTRG
jgi:release factor glutamine methyltransferase